MSKTLNRRQRAARIAELTATKVQYEGERDRLIELYEVNPAEVDGERINKLHDFIWALEQDIHLTELGPIEYKGDYCDRTSRWHY